MLANVSHSDESTENQAEVEIYEVTDVTEAVVDGWERLVGQLSSTAPPPSRDWLRQIVNSDSVLYVAAIGGHVVGSLTLCLCRIPVGLKAWIEDVVVDETVRGRRIGEKLTWAAIERAQRDGARNINLESRPSREAAHKLYQRVGFIERETKVYRFASGDKNTGASSDKNTGASGDKNTGASSDKNTGASGDKRNVNG